MTTAMTTNGATPPLPVTVEKVLIQGDLSGLKPEEKVAYYNKVCESLGLNPLTQPFDYIRFQGKEKLYAKRDATDQLRRIYGISVTITKREVVDGVLTVVAVGTTPDGREDEDIGCLPVAGLKGESLALAMMKTTTKAKRRVTLSICGLGWLDETEIEEVPEAGDVEPKPKRPKRTIAQIRAAATQPPATAVEFDAQAKAIAENTPPPSEREPGDDADEEQGPPTVDQLLAAIGELSHPKHAESWRAKHRADVAALAGEDLQRVTNKFYERFPTLKPAKKESN